MPRKEVGNCFSVDFPLWCCHGVAVQSQAEHFSVAHNQVVQLFMHLYFIPTENHCCCCFTIASVVVVVKKISMWTAATESPNEVVAEMAAQITLACTFIKIYIKSTGGRRHKYTTYISRPLQHPQGHLTDLQCI